MSSKAKSSSSSLSLRLFSTMAGRQTRNGHGHAFLKLLANGQFEIALSYLQQNASVKKEVLRRSSNNEEGANVRNALQLLVNALVAPKTRKAKRTERNKQKDDDPPQEELEDDRESHAVLLEILKILLDDGEDIQDDNHDTDNDETKFSEGAEHLTTENASFAAEGARKGTAARRTAFFSSSSSSSPLETAVGQRPSSSESLGQTRNEVIRCMLRRHHEPRQNLGRVLALTWHQWNDNGCYSVPVPLGVLGGMRYIDRFILERVRIQGKPWKDLGGTTFRHNINCSCDEDEADRATRTAELMDFYRRAEVVFEGCYYPRSLSQGKPCLLHAMCISAAENVASGGKSGIIMPMSFFRIAMALHPRPMACRGDAYHANTPPLSLILSTNNKPANTCWDAKLTDENAFGLPPETRRERYVNVIWELVKYYPGVARPMDDYGRVPLHYALDGDFFRYELETEQSKIIRILHHMIQDYPQSISHMDPLTGFFPWMMVASQVLGVRAAAKKGTRQKAPPPQAEAAKNAEPKVSLPLLSMCYAMLRNDPSTIPASALEARHDA